MQDSEPSSFIKNISKFLCFLGVFTMLMTPTVGYNSARAEVANQTGASRIFNFARKRANNLYGHVREGIYTVAALGAIAIAVAAFFGKFKWSTLFYWALGLFLLGGVQALIDLLYYGNFL